VVSVILVVDPLVGLVAGMFWFGETVDRGTDAVVCAIVLLAGVVLTHDDRPRESGARGHEHDRDDGRGSDRSRVEHGRGG